MKNQWKPRRDLVKLATLQLKPTAIPKFCKARSVPFALQTAVERELDRFEGEGILERVPCSQWQRLYQSQKEQFVYVGITR